MRQLFQELKRRNVYRVAVTYAVVAFVAIQAADLLVPQTTLPAWSDQLLIYLAVFGFPVALVLAWAFEMTPEGVRRTPAAEPLEEGGPPEAARSRSRVALKALVGLGVVSAAVAGGWYLMGGGGETEPRAGERSIAVLPFEALGKEETGAFTEGMHDALLTRLSNVSGLKVISRTSVQQYRGTNKTTAEIARELGVKWVVEGGVQEMGEQIQVNAQLIDPRTDTHAWAQSYRRDLTAEDLFALQTEITKKIARSLEAELSPEETERVERRPTESLDAYRLYVQGRRLLDQRTAASIDSARDYFERALRQDSTYALAWAGLADSRVLYAVYSTLDAREAYAAATEAAIPEAKVAADRALKLAPDLAEAHATRANIYMTEQSVKPSPRNGPTALRELKRALELKPSYAQAHQWLGLLHMALNRPEAALEHLHLAVELNPEHRSARWALIGGLLANGEYERARTEARRLRERYPEKVYGPVFEARVSVHQGRWKQLRNTLRPYLSETEEPDELLVSYLALAEVAAGDTASARSRLEQVKGEEDPVALALVQAALGNADAALAALRKPYVEGPRRFPEYFVALRYLYPNVLESVRADPRYEQLIREVNRAWGLNPDGSLPDSVDVSF